MKYKVKFINAVTGKGFIDGYQTAKRAKLVTEIYNVHHERDKVTYPVRAEYLGKTK